MQAELSLGGRTSQLVVARGSRHQFFASLKNSSQQTVVVTDHNLKAAWSQEWPSDWPCLSVPPGEESKDLQTAAGLWSELVKLGLDRKSRIVAIGGGMVCDLAGFVASTFMRGVDFFSLPTSLLAMVDASVGGKVGIDLPEGKNLVGQFYPATRVVVDTDFLRTLPAEQWSEGMAEVIKHAILSPSPLWERLQSFSPDHKEQAEAVEELVKMAVSVKVQVVEKDPFERKGLRAHLNLGHSYGHALEWCSEYSLSHGQAVALGLLAGLELSQELGSLTSDFRPELRELVARWGLPLSLGEQQIDWQWSDMRQAFARDKKNKGGKWAFVLPRALGRVETIWGPDEELVKSAYEKLLGAT